MERLSIKYRPEIDGLRAIAVLAVVFYHAGFGPSAGFVGVDVFFVISGYLITALLSRESAITGRLDLIAFYARRVRRIFPALVVVIFCTVVASMILLSPFGQKREVANSAAASLLFVGNLFFQAKTGSYFDASADHLPLLHLWSLSVEEQFYAIWPILIIVLCRLQIQSRIAVTSLLVLASFIFSEVLIDSTPNAAFYQMPPRFWELGLGGVIALLPSDSKHHGRVEIMLGVGIVLLAIFTPVIHFPGFGALPAVLGTALVIHAVHSSSALGTIGAWLGSRPMAFIGRISYSLYLWHWPLLALYRASHIDPPGLPVRISIIALAFILAWLSYQFVEQPWRRAEPDSSNARLVMSAIVMVASLAYLVMNVGTIYHKEPLANTLSARTARDKPANLDACNYSDYEELYDFPKSGCNSVPDRPVTVAIWGDSHALAWQPLAWAIAERKGAAATSYTRYACPPALNFDNSKPGKDVSLCRDFNSMVFNRIVASNLDTVILTALWPTWKDPSNFKEKFEATVHRLAPKVHKIILLGPTPYLNGNTSECIETGKLDACAVPRARFDEQNRAIRLYLQDISRKYANVEYVELADFFCGPDICPVLKDGYSLYWDSNHVSSTAARNFAAWYLGKP